jgi:hypothetical protein
MEGSEDNSGVEQITLSLVINILAMNLVSDLLVQEFKRAHGTISEFFVGA